MIHSMLTVHCGMRKQDWGTFSHGGDVLYDYWKIYCIYIPFAGRCFLKHLTASWGHTFVVRPQWDFELKPWQWWCNMPATGPAVCYSEHGPFRLRFAPLHYNGWFDILQFWVGLDVAVASLGASIFSLESTFSFVDSASPSLGGNIQARAAAAVPSPLWREKQRKVAQTKAQQPVKEVRTYRGTKAKFRNWGRQIKIRVCLYHCTGVLHVYISINNSDLLFE